MSKVTKLTTKKPNSKAALATSLRRAQELIAVHALILVCVVGGLAIGFSLIRARSYLNPPRNDDRYNDATSKLNYSKIDQTVLGRLKQTQNDKENQIGQSLAPNRSNPFNE